MKVTERFLRYVSFDTQSAEHSTTTPSTEKQKVLGEVLATELSQMGLRGAHMDDKGYVYGWLPATPGCEGVPCVGLIAHMDTSPDAPGANVRARVCRYEGGDLPLSDTVVMRAAEFESLSRQVGEELIVTDGTTLLGADDKAGVAEILTAMETLLAHPERPHGRVALCVTPDEEVGTGADYVDLDKLGADFGYTVDGGPLGGLEYENFNAAEVDVLFHGVNIHPGEGKNKLRNACLMAAQFIAMVPPAESPAHTEGYEGFYHLCSMTGDESQARLQWLIRDHDWEGFRDRKRTMEGIGFYLETRYGVGTVEVTITDAYYNMKEEILPHPQLLDWAREAFRRAGVEPRDVPIRGGTDGAKLSWRGLPCPNLSTGGYHFHGVHEYIPVEALETMANVLVHLVTSAAEEKI